MRPHLNPIYADNFTPCRTVGRWRSISTKAMQFTKNHGKPKLPVIFSIYPADFALSRFCGKISIAVISEAGHGLLYR